MITFDNGVFGSRFANLLDWWQTREPRERVMLGLMVAALALFVLWLGMFILRQAKASALSRYDRAAADLVEIESSVLAIASLQAQRPTAPRGELFARAILDAAAASQVPVSRQRVDDAGVLTVGIDAVTALALLGWLDGLQRQQGIAPHSLLIDERNGQLQVEVAFRPAAP